MALFAALEAIGETIVAASMFGLAALVEGIKVLRGGF